MTHNPCPLCHSVKTNFFTNAMDRNYFLCSSCKLTFVPKEFFLSKSEEKKRYDLHENSIEDVGYVTFLSEISLAITSRITPPSYGLDFGSGPTPVLAEILRQKDFDIKIYDLFYSQNKDVLNASYDFVCLSEVAEHFYKPALEFKNLIKLLNPKGYLFITTACTDTIINFENWYYQKDETHVCFYASESMQYIANKHSLSLEKASEKLFIFQKNT